jgi:hypothetical protein
MARKNFGDGALRLIGPTTATGFSDVASIKPISTITAQIVASSSAITGTIAVDGSLDGNVFAEILAATTFRTPASGTVFMTSTSADAFTNLRANLVVTGSTEDISIYIAGR